MFSNERDPLLTNTANQIAAILRSDTAVSSCEVFPGGIVIITMIDGSRTAIQIHGWD